MPATKKTTAVKPAKPVDAVVKPAQPVDAGAKPAEPAMAVAKPAQPVDAVAKPAQPVDAVAKPAEPVKAVAKPAKPVKAVAKPAKPVDAAIAARKETVEPVVKGTAKAASKSVETAVAVTREPASVAANAGNDVLKAYEDAVTYGKDNFDAVRQANDVFSKGFQDINNVLFACVKSTFEDSATVTKKFFACTSVQEVVDLQNTLVQSTYSKAVDQSKKITDMSVKVTEETAVPLSRRLNVTVEKITKPLAA